MTTAAIELMLLTTQFKAEYDAAMAMLARMPSEKNIVLRMVQPGTNAATSLGQTAERDAAQLEGAYSGMAGTVDRESSAMSRDIGNVESSLGNLGTSTARTEEDTKTHMSGAASALSSFGGAAGNAVKDVEGFHSKTLSSLQGVAGPLTSILPTAAAIGFGAIIYQSANTAHQLTVFQEQAGVSIDVAKQWLGAANEFQVPQRALSMTLKNLGQMLNNVQFATEGSSKAMLADKNLTADVVIRKQDLLIAQAKLTEALSKYGNSSTQAAQAEVSVEKAHLSLTDAEAKLAAMQGQVNGLTAKQAQSLSQLGLLHDVESGKIHTQTALILAMADAYQNATDKQAASAEITQVLGGRAYALLPLIEQGGAALQDSLTQGATALQQYNSSNTNSLNQAWKNINTIKDAMEHALVDVAASLTPVVNYIATHLSTFEHLALIIGGLYAFKKTWGFGEAIISDLGQIIHLGGSAFGIVSKLGGGTGGGSSPAGNIVGRVIGQSVTVMAFGPEAIAVLESSGRGLNIPNPANIVGDVGKFAAGSEIVDTAAGAAASGGVAAAAVGAVLALPIMAGVGGWLAYANQQRAANNRSANAVDSALNTDVSGKPGALSKYATDPSTGVRLNNMTNFQAFQGDMNTLFAGGGMGLTGKLKLIQQQWDILWNIQKDGLAQTKGEMAKWLDAVQHIDISSADLSGAWTDLTAKSKSFLNAQLPGMLQAMGISVGQTQGAASDLEYLYKHHKVTTEGQMTTAIRGWMLLNAASGGAGASASQIALFIAKTQGVAVTNWPAIAQSIVDLNTAMSHAATDAADVDGVLKNIKKLLLTDPTAAGALSKVRQQSTKFAGGGVLTEHVLGVGMSTGTQYEFAEAGVPEAFYPLTGGGAATPIGALTGGAGGTVIEVVVTGNTLLSSRDIDDLIRRIEDRLVPKMLALAGRKFTL